MEVTGIYTSFSMEGSLDPFEQLLTIIEMKNENKKTGILTKNPGSGIRKKIKDVKSTYYLFIS